MGIVVELDERGVVTACSSTLLMDLARDFFARLLTGRSLVTERAEIEADIHTFYLGHSQAALLFALHQVFEAVDLSTAPFAAGGRHAEGARRRPAVASSPKGRNDRRRRVARGARRRRAADCHGARGVARGAATDQSPGRRGTRRHVVGGAAARI